MSLHSSEHYQNGNLMSGKTYQNPKPLEFKGAKVIHSLKRTLEGTLNCVNFIKERVHSNILAKINEKSTECSQVRSGVNIKSPIIPKDNSLNRIESFTNDSYIISKESEQTTINGVDCNSEERINTNFIESQLLNEPAEKQITSINQPNSLSTMNCTEQEKLIMISLLSDDEELDSDSSKIFTPCPDGNSIKSSSSIIQEVSTTNRENNGTSAVSENTIVKSGLSETIHYKTTEKRTETRSNDVYKQAKKKKVVAKDICCQPKGFDFCGDFYKVKLSNLHPRISYGQIASLLKKAGLDFVDILLVNSGSLSKLFAEISFSDLATREKAVSLDKTLSHMGMKIKIKAI